MYIQVKSQKTKFMNKNFMNRLTMLAVTLMASMACFAQGKSGEATDWGSTFPNNFQELKYDVTNGSPHLVDVIGFSDGVIANPDIMDDPTLANVEGVTIVKNTVSIPHWLDGGVNKPSVYNRSVKDNAFASVDETLAGKIKTITIDYKDREYINGVPLVIGANAFAGLTSVTTVECYAPTPPTCPEGAFATSVYEDATLVVPTGSMPAYANTDGWSNFYTIVNADGYEHGDVNIDDKVNKTDITIFRKWLNEDDDVDYDKILDEEDLDFNNDGKVNKTDITALRNWMNRD
jgi:hypothetical protein